MVRIIQKKIIISPWAADRIEKYLHIGIYDAKDLLLLVNLRNILSVLYAHQCQKLSPLNHKATENVTLSPADRDWRHIYTGWY